MRVEQFTKEDSLETVVHTCPYCRTKAFFQRLGDDHQISTQYASGERFCPNCKGHIFVVFEWRRFKMAYPPIRIDFDTQDIPDKIVNTFSEGLDCHSHDHHIAAAIMVRRTLEEICADRGAKGKDLKDRISDLRGRVILPPELFEAMDELRLLGNDAAHVEAKGYEEIGAEELQAAIEFTKEILKGVYQYKGLLTKLQELKKRKTPEQGAAADPDEPGG
jgi:hypothetical protein